MRRPILIHPDPILKRRCAPVAAVCDKVGRLMDDMLETMYAAPGIGLAAPQIGVARRVLVMDCASREAADGDDEPEPDPDPLCLANPEIVWSSEETLTREEGCLSIPDVFAEIVRAESVRVTFLNRDGAPEEREFSGIRSICVQHEIDHLNGRLFIDYLGPMRRRMITQKMTKLKKTQPFA